MATRGRPPKPIELHRLQGTYRKDRHGPKLAPVRPPVLRVVEPILTLTCPDDHDYHCPTCGAPIVIELLPDRRWQWHHAGETDCVGAA